MRPILPIIIHKNNHCVINQNVTECTLAKTEKILSDIPQFSKLCVQ